MEEAKFYGVCVAIEKNGKLLLIRRSDDQSCPGLWEFPGGRSESGEENDKFKAARREVREETNLDVGHLDYVGEYTRLIRDGTKVGHMHLFYCNTFSGHFKLNEEHSAYNWMSKKEIEESEYEIANDVKKFLELKKEIY